MKANEIIIVDQDTGEISVPEKIITAIRENEEQIRRAKRENEGFKKDLLAAMEMYGVEKIESEYFAATYVKEHMQQRLDSKAVETKHPEVYNECLKAVPVKSSVRVTLKPVI